MISSYRTIISCHTFAAWVVPWLCM